MALHEESLTLDRKGEHGTIILSHALGAVASLGQGDHQQARVLCKKGLELSRQFKTVHLTAAYLRISASLASSRGQPLRSARLWGAAESLRQAIGAILSPFERYIDAPYIDAARAGLDEAAWEAAWAEGKAMSPEEAVEYALSKEESAPTETPIPKELPTGRQHSVLTRREREVATLVARGLTNRQISSKLSLSERTVDAHVRKILKKLGFNSRSQVAAWVAQRGLPP